MTDIILIMTDTVHITADTVHTIIHTGIMSLLHPQQGPSYAHILQKDQAVLLRPQLIIHL